MLKNQINYAKKIAKAYVLKTNKKEDYKIAFNIGMYVYNTGKYNYDSIKNFLDNTEDNYDIDIDTIIMILINTKFDEDQKEIENHLRNINKKIKIRKIPYPDKEAILDIGFKKCTRKGYSALQTTLDEFDSDEMRIIRKFIERYVKNLDMEG